MSEISILTVDGVSFNLSDDKVRGSLSEVEMTPRASKTYAVGDYLIYQGRFYKVVQVIDQDSFFEIGTNIIPVTVGEELELKASLESPTFSGSPKVPTADVGTRTTQIASTAYVQSELDSVKERIQSVQNGLDGIDSNIGDRVTAVAASTTTAWMNAHITNTDSVLLDSSLTVEGAAADAKAVGDAIDELPKIVNTDEVGADFDLADSDGNVLVRFADGHIKVKNFDSSTLSDSFNEKIDIQQDSSDVGKALVVGEDGKVSPADISIDVDTTLSIEGAVADAKAVGDALDALSDEIVDSIDTLSDELDSSINELDSSIDSRISSLNEDITNIGNPPKIVETEETDADLYVADDDGYVAVKIENGHIKTARFNSDNIPNAFPTDANTALNIADKNGYVALQLSEGHIKTKCFDSSLCAGLPEYRIENGNLYLSFGYTNENDAVVVMNVGRANNLFDFASFKLKSKGVPLNLASLTSLESVWTSSSDMHSPFQFYALNNPDGYWSGSTNPGYSGGNHTQTINGTVMKTASSRYVHFFADGKPVSSGYGTFSKFEIKWANNVQAYNCIKADGTGRTSLIEYHDMIFDGIKFDETVTLVPQEDIKLKLWEAFATVSWGSTYNKIRFIDGENRNEYNYVSGETYKSGNSATSGMILTGASHGLEMRMDITCDLGKRTFYHGDAGAHTGGQKAYFYVIYETTQMAENDAYFVHGSFRFFPVVA